MAKKLTASDDKNPCTLDSCDAGKCTYAIGNEGLTCGNAETSVKGKCSP